MRFRSTLISCLVLAVAAHGSAAPAPLTLNVWPGQPPGETKPLPPETDTTKADGRQVKDAPPMFFVHPFDDGVPVQNALLLAAELKKVDVPVEVHVYDTGGHGYQ